jgi:hypothetical protein
VTLRNETEWIESVETGMNTVVGLDLPAAQAAMSAPVSRKGISAVYPPGASDRIASLLIAK